MWLEGAMSKQDMMPNRRRPGNDVDVEHQSQDGPAEVAAAAGGRAAGAAPGEHGPRRRDRRRLHRQACAGTSRAPLTWERVASFPAWCAEPLRPRFGVGLFRLLYLVQLWRVGLAAQRPRWLPATPYSFKAFAVSSL